MRQARHAIGQVTFEDGKPITGDVQDTNKIPTVLPESAKLIFTLKPDQPEHRWPGIGADHR